MAILANQYYTCLRCQQSIAILPLPRNNFQLPIAALDQLTAEVARCTTTVANSMALMEQCFLAVDSQVLAIVL